MSDTDPILAPHLSYADGGSLGFDEIPKSLRNLDQWVLWREEKRDDRTTKIPYQPNQQRAKSNDPNTWCSLSTAREALESGDLPMPEGSWTGNVWGLGFVFSTSDLIVGLDLDDCVEGSKLTPVAQRIVEGIDSYAEWSPSGDGLHILCRGVKPVDSCKALDVPGMKEIEIYEDGRFFTFTGHRIDGRPQSVNVCRESLHEVCHWAFTDEDDEEEPTPRSNGTPKRDLSETEIWDLIEQADDDKIQRLWSGDTSLNDHDHSRADSALCCKLYFYGADKHQIDELFRQSGLMRPKWDEQRGNQTYGEMTIQNAIDEVDERHSALSGDGAPTSQHHTNGEANRVDNVNSKDDKTDPWESVRATYDSNKGEGRVEAADQLIEELNIATHRGSGRLYVWDDAEKVYADDGEESVRERLVDVLRSRFSQHEVSEILGMVKPKTYREEFGADGFVPVANGDLKVTADTVELTDPTPEHGFRNRSSAEWDPSADAPVFQTYLKQVVKTEEERKTLQEYAGYSLMYWGLPFHKALFLVGPQASGKSTFLSALQEMLGKTTQLSPQQLVDDEYGAIELEDSWANIASDIPSSLLSNVGRFKEITAGDRIHARRIYEQGYTIRPTAKHFYSANQLPEIKIDDNAFFRRVMIVAFPETVDREDRDPKLGQKLKLEIDGILRWAVEGLQRLLKNEDFTRDLTPQETRRLWDEHASSIGQFKIRCLNVTGDNGHAVPKDGVYDAYGQFCMDKGLPTESQRKLTRVLKRDPRIGQAKRKPAGADERCRCYTGVEIHAGGEDAPL